MWRSAWQFFSQSVFLWPLLLCSVAALAIFLHRLFALRRGLVMPSALLAALRRGEPAEVIGRLAKGDSALAAITRTAVLTPHASLEAATQATEARARHEVLKLQSGLSTMEIIITVAPLLGLLGTVSGLVTVFSGLGGSAEETNTQEVAKGIAEALNTTIAGLAIAIPTVVAHGAFQRKIERIAVEMELLFQETLARLHRREAEQARR